MPRAAGAGADGRGWNSWSGSPRSMFRRGLIHAERDGDGGQVVEPGRPGPRDGRRRADLVLVAVPVEVDPLLAQQVLEDGGSVLLVARNPVK